MMKYMVFWLSLSVVAILSHFMIKISKKKIYSGMKGIYYKNIYLFSLLISQSNFVIFRSAQEIILCTSSIYCVFNYERCQHASNIVTGQFRVPPSLIVIKFVIVFKSIQRGHVLSLHPEKV